MSTMANVYYYLQKQKHMQPMFLSDPHYNHKRLGFFTFTTIIQMRKPRFSLA